MGEIYWLPKCKKIVFVKHFLNLKPFFVYAFFWSDCIDLTTTLLKMIMFCFWKYLLIHYIYIWKLLRIQIFLFSSLWHWFLPPQYWKGNQGIVLIFAIFCALYLLVPVMMHIVSVVTHQKKSHWWMKQGNLVNFYKLRRRYVMSVFHKMEPKRLLLRDRVQLLFLF